jgi:hypothetical protein
MSEAWTLKERSVNRETFERHLGEMAAGLTEVPATLYLGAPAIEQNTGYEAGEGTISYFIKNGITLVNDTARGMQVSWLARSLPEHSAILDEEEEIASEKGRTLRYVIGGVAHSRFAWSHRVDPHPFHP